VLDLDYAEDSAAEVDANFVMTGAGGIVEIQGTAEQSPFSEVQFQSMLRLAQKGIEELTVMQKKILGA
jgi:ribonuclease PH